MDMKSIRARNTISCAKALAGVMALAGATACGGGTPAPSPSPSPTPVATTTTTTTTTTSSTTAPQTSAAPATTGPVGDVERATFAASLGVRLDAMVRRPSGLYVQDLKTGTGAV